MLAPRLLRAFRVLRWAFSLVIAVSVGWAILHTPSTAMGPQTHELPLPLTSHSEGSGQGAGGSHAGVSIPGVCNPFDTACFLDGFASSAAQSIMNAFTPVIDTFLKNPINILNQTPPADSYQNPTVIALNTLFAGVIDAALACLLVIGGYTILVGSHLSMPQSSLRELLPRVILVVAAVHFNLHFFGLLIDLENTLNLAVIHATDTQILTNTIASLLSLNPTAGLLLIILAIVLGIMTVLLLVQMIVRIALVDLLLALAPLGLGCLMLQQTVRWGRLWLTAISAAVWVQFIALALGSIFLSAMSVPGTIFHGNLLATAFLVIGTLGLVLKIPGMLHHWALSPMWQSGQSHADSHEGGWDTGGDVAGGSGSGGWEGTVVEGTIITESGAAGDSIVLLLA